MLLTTTPNEAKIVKSTKAVIDTKSEANFLSASEIAEIEHLMDTTEHASAPDTNYGRSKPMADYHYIRFYEDGAHRRINEILLPRLQRVLHPDIYIDDCHIMQSVQPYTPHSDTLTPEPRDGYRHAWTIIIPLADYNSNTFVFEEECPWTKDVLEWAKAEQITPKKVISDDFYRRYFTHSRKEDFDYLTIHEVFPWRKGWLSATSRTRFHCSDNYLAKGLTSKRALVMWTTIPSDR